MRFRARALGDSALLITNNTVEEICFWCRQADAQLLRTF
jgi:hypothetical protein